MSNYRTVLAKNLKMAGIPARADIDEREIGSLILYNDLMVLVAPDCKWLFCEIGSQMSESEFSKLYKEHKPMSLAQKNSIISFIESHLNDNDAAFIKSIYGISHSLEVKGLPKDLSRQRKTECLRALRYFSALVPSVFNFPSAEEIISGEVRTPRNTRAFQRQIMGLPLISDDGFVIFNRHYKKMEAKTIISRYRFSANVGDAKKMVYEDSLPIEYIGLPEGILNTLRKEGIWTLEELAEEVDSINQINGIGEAKERVIRERLSEFKQLNNG